ncbi:hypothetical protein R1sor_021269 [Riccia sorocarpa]|uniref:Uncharacterized protein n=1 Tax=Riccia sorocarpa TaxID=122646 RepID=A0ABD3GGL0_9MARC
MGVIVVLIGWHGISSVNVVIGLRNLGDRCFAVVFGIAVTLLCRLDTVLHEGQTILLPSARVGGVSSTLSLRMLYNHGCCVSGLIGVYELTQEVVTAECCALCGRLAVYPGRVKYETASVKRWPRGPVRVATPCSLASSSSSSNSEMRPRAMARAVNAVRGAGRHRMTKHDYELIVTYLEVPENFAAVTGSGRKIKVGGRNLTKTTAFGHMAVSLCAQGFTLCNGNKMGKKVMRYVEMYKKARIFYLSTGAGLTDDDIAAGLSFEQKMERMCHFFYRMHALYDARCRDVKVSVEKALGLWL